MHQPAHLRTEELPYIEVHLAYCYASRCIIMKIESVSDAMVINGNHSFEQKLIWGIFRTFDQCNKLFIVQ